MIAKVELKKFAQKCGLDILMGDGTRRITLATDMINRPGLLLSGFEDYFVSERVQVIGNAEKFLLLSMGAQAAARAANLLFSKKPPCVIIARNGFGEPYFSEAASKYGVPVLTSAKSTELVINDVTNFLYALLAESVSVHGTLMEVSGVGVLITGESGMGKSETALELVHRGHKLVADDAVIAKKIADEIIGTSPESIRYFMEVRGIGIIDVRELFGVGSVLYDNPIDLVVKLERWTTDSESERLVYEPAYEDILGVKIPKYTVPVMAGRNIAIVIEVACRNHRLRLMGHNAAQRLMDKQNFSNPE